MSRRGELPPVEPVRVAEALAGVRGGRGDERGSVALVDQPRLPAVVTDGGIAERRDLREGPEDRLVLPAPGGVAAPGEQLGLEQRALERLPRVHLASIADRRAGAAAAHAEIG